MEGSDLELLCSILEKDRLPLTHFEEELRREGKRHKDIATAAAIRRDGFYYLKGLFVYYCVNIVIRAAEIFREQPRTSS